MDNRYKNIPEISIETIDAYFAERSRPNAPLLSTKNIQNPGIKHLIERIKRIDRSDLEKSMYIAGFIDALELIERQIQSNNLEGLI